MVEVTHTLEPAKFPVTDVAFVYNKAALSSDFRWVAVWTKPRAEKVVASTLASIHSPVWLPTMRVKRRWSDRWKEIEMPLFSSYLFAQTSTSTWASLLRVPGVLTVVKQARKPAWIREHQIVELRLAVARVAAFGDREPEVVDDFEPGARVRVISGPMAGLIGVVRETRGNRRLFVGFEQIGKALGFSIGMADVERDDKPPVMAAAS